MAFRTTSLGIAAACAIALGAGTMFWNSSATAQPEGMDVGQMLVQGLQHTEGCMKVETGQTSSGRNCIFAWFENKEAVERWYWSETHQGAMRALMGGTPGENHVPMKSVADDVGPVLVIASLVPSEADHLEEVALPISAIAIELYKPLNAGAFIGSSFGPPEIYGDGMHVYE